MSGYRAGLVDDTLALGALTALTVTKGDMSQTASEKKYVSSIDCAWAITGLTPDEGPILFGVAHSDLSAAEIEAYLETTGSWDRGDLIAQEVNSRGRYIRQIGKFAGGETDEVFNEGRKLKTKIGFMIQTGKTLSIWAYNKSGSTLSTGATITANGVAHLFDR